MPKIPPEKGPEREGGDYMHKTSFFPPPHSFSPGNATNAPRVLKGKSKTLIGKFHCEKLFGEKGGEWGRNILKIHGVCQVVEFVGQRGGGGEEKKKKEKRPLGFCF